MTWDALEKLLVYLKVQRLFFRIPFSSTHSLRVDDPSGIHVCLVREFSLDTLNVRLQAANLAVNNEHHHKGVSLQSIGHQFVYKVKYIMCLN